MSKEIYLNLNGIDKEYLRKTRQRLFKLDTYGYTMWVEKEFDWVEDSVVCEKRDVHIDLEKCDFRVLKDYGSYYVFEEYLIAVGDYDTSLPKTEFEKIYRYLVKNKN